MDRDEACLEAQYRAVSLPPWCYSVGACKSITRSAAAGKVEKWHVLLRATFGRPDVIGKLMASAHVNLLRGLSYEQLWVIVILHTRSRWFWPKLFKLGKTVWPFGLNSSEDKKSFSKKLWTLGSFRIKREKLNWKEFKSSSIRIHVWNRILVNAHCGEKIQ